ncbi:Major Facilitator Superfamily protein [uncultured archaeon]|nr:Major Facilitator Superfamily protein [uncultured archaeon]
MPGPGRSSNGRTTALRERTKRLAILEGMMWAAQNGVGAYFITPFALMVGASDFAIGLLRAFSTLSSAIGYYAGAWLLQFEKGRRELISKFTTIQAFSWLLLAILPLLPTDRAVLLVLFYSLMSFVGSMISPAWTSMMSDVVVGKERGEYFGRRSKISGFVEFAMSILTGAFLSWMTGNLLLGFGITFFLAFLFRYISSQLLKRHWDPPFKPDHESFISVVKPPNDPYLKNLIYLSAGMVFATGIAGPFFAVFMLRDLHFSYIDFAIATAASTFATLISQPYWGKVIDKYGTRPVMFATALLIPFIAILWIPADSFAYVILIQLYSGVVWAGFDLANFNMLLKISPRKTLHDYAAHMNGLGALTTFFGSIAGSFLALFLEGSTIGLLNSIQTIFLISAVARFVVAALTVPRITKTMTVDGPRFLIRVITVYPMKGVMAELTEFQNTFASLTNYHHR